MHTKLLSTDNVATMLYEFVAYECGALESYIICIQLTSRYQLTIWVFHPATLAYLYLPCCTHCNLK